MSWNLAFPAGALVVLAGPPGAGKSTLTRRAAPQLGELSIDGCLRTLQEGVPEDAKPGWAEAFEAFFGAVDERLARGEGALAEITGLHEPIRRELRDIASHHSVPAHLLWIDTGEADCRAGIRARGGDGPSESQLRSYYTEWAHLRENLQELDDEQWTSVLVIDRHAAANLASLRLL